MMEQDLEQKSKEENNIGKWDGWYVGLENTPSPFRYGQTETYQRAAEFLENCSQVEDWGCGAGGFMQYRPDTIGIDGSDTPLAKKKFVDLRVYKSKVEGIHIRHVFEHNYAWKEILQNALESAEKKLVITLFIPLTEGVTKEIAHNKQHGVDVPDLYISREEFLSVITPFRVKEMTMLLLNTATGYGHEEMIFITK